MHSCMSDVNDGCWAIGEGNIEKSFRVAGGNRTYDLHNIGQMLTKSSCT